MTESGVNIHAERTIVYNNTQAVQHDPSFPIFFFNFIVIPSFLNFLVISSFLPHILQ